MARVSGTTCAAAIKLHQPKQPKLNPGNRSVAHKTVWEWLGDEWPAAPRYSSGQARFCANEWKSRATRDPAKAAISEGQSILLKAGTLDAVVGCFGPLKNNLDQPEQEETGYRLPKPCGALGQTEKADPTDRDLDNVDPPSMEEDLMQIFIKSIGGRHYCIQISKRMSIKELKKEIQIKLGTPTTYQNLIYTGHSDNHTLQDYGITKDSTIILNLRLWGKCKGDSSKTSSSFLDAVKGKGHMQNKPAPTSELPGPYIVEQKLESPMLTVSLPEVTDLYTDLAQKFVICRFNGFWPKSDALHQWIFSTWSPNCEIYLCPKGFFIVRFNTKRERDNIINQGPWFWGNAGLFITP